MLRTRTALLVQVAIAAVVIVASGSAAIKTAVNATAIASATSLDYRVVVTAHKSSSGNTRPPG